jgi:hypothetical protein
MLRGGYGMSASVGKKVGTQHLGAVDAIPVHKEEACLWPSVLMREIKEIVRQFGILDPRTVAIGKVDSARAVQ